MYKVVLDPGHGYNTPGKRSPDSSLMEYEFNQVVADMAEKILLAHNIQVKVTKRMNDKDVSLTQRCKIANDWGAKVFISIHANAYGTGWNDANGFEIYHYGMSASGNKLARIGHKYGLEAVSKFGVRDRGVKSANFTVLSGTNMPAVLFEFAFFTNKQECELLKRQDFRQACAEAVAKTACEALGVRYVPQNKPKQPSQPVVDNIQPSPNKESVNVGRPVVTYTTINIKGKEVPGVIINGKSYMSVVEGCNAINEASKLAAIWNEKQHKVEVK